MKNPIFTRRFLRKELDKGTGGDWIIYNWCVQASSWKPVFQIRSDAVYQNLYRPCGVVVYIETKDLAVGAWHNENWYHKTQTKLWRSKKRSDLQCSSDDDILIGCSLIYICAIASLARGNKRKRHNSKIIYFWCLFGLQGTFGTFQTDWLAW